MDRDEGELRRAVSVLLRCDLCASAHPFSADQLSGPGDGLGPTTGGTPLAHIAPSQRRPGEWRFIWLWRPGPKTMDAWWTSGLRPKGQYAETEDVRVQADGTLLDMRPRPPTTPPAYMEASPAGPPWLSSPWGHPGEYLSVEARPDLSHVEVRCHRCTTRWRGLPMATLAPAAKAMQDAGPWWVSFGLQEQRRRTGPDSVTVTGVSMTARAVLTLWLGREGGADRLLREPKDSSTRDLLRWPSVAPVGQLSPRELAQAIARDPPAASLARRLLGATCTEHPGRR